MPQKEEEEMIRINLDYYYETRFTPPFKINSLRYLMIEKHPFT